MLDSIDQNVFIALDAQWGEGKTFFVRQIEMTLKYYNKQCFGKEVSDEEESGISRGKSGDYFKVFRVIEAEGIIVSDIACDFPAENKRNEAGNGAEPKENKPGPIAIGKFRIHGSKICAIGGDEPSEND